MEQDDRFSESLDLKASLTVTLYDNQDFYYKKLEKGFNTASFFEVQARESESLQLLDDFYLTPDLNKEKLITLKCTYDDMIYYPKNNLFEQERILQEDLIGAEVKMKGNEANKMYPHELLVILYEKQVPGCFTSMGRKRRDIVFYHHDIEKLLIWKNLLCYVAKDKRYLETKQKNFRKKKVDLFDFTFLVFVNPASGKGHAEKVWAESKAMLKLAGYQFEEIRTERRNHARDVILQMNPEQLFSYCGIITVSGDGLPHEVLQALGSRKDSEKALKIGLAALPGGSGNALARNVAGRSQEQPDTQGATFIIIKSKKLSIDLLELTLTEEDQKRNDWPTNKILSFLSICCAYLADVDLNSEHLRFLGELRFDVQGTIRALCQKHINIEVKVRHKDQIQNQYKAPQNNQEQEQEEKLIQQQQQQQQEFESFKGKCKYLQFQNMPYISTNNYTAPVSEMDDGLLDLQLIMNQSWGSLLCQAIDFQQGDQFTAGKNKKPVRKSLTHRMCTDFIINSTDDSYILFSVDGERYDCKTIKGKVLPKSFKIFCNK